MVDSVPERIVDAARSHSGHREKSRGVETILVVEDDRSVLAVVCAILRKHGYEVLEALSGAAAITMCEQHPEFIDLLLSDIVLARMNGPQLAARLATSRPEMKVLYMSGHGAGSMFAAAIQASGARLLQKPITSDVLVRHVRELLGAQSKPEAT